MIKASFPPQKKEENDGKRKGRIKMQYRKGNTLRERTEKGKWNEEVMKIKLNA